MRLEKYSSILGDVPPFAKGIRSLKHPEQRVGALKKESEDKIL